VKPGTASAGTTAPLPPTSISPGLSARGHHRVLRVAQTLADLDGREHVAVEDVMRALSYRQDAVEAAEVAA